MALMLLRLTKSDTARSSLDLQFVCWSGAKSILLKLPQFLVPSFPDTPETILLLLLLSLILFGLCLNSGHNIIFNVTPSPGGTTCLGTAETDMRTICNTLGANVNEAKFRKILLEGAYPVER